MISRVLILPLLLLLSACPAREASAAKPQPPPPPPPPVADVTSERYQSPELPRGHVILPDAFGGQHAVEVEVAATPDSRQRGLMWRRELADGKGMLFIFPEDEVQSFWMRNTLIALDMLFIDSQNRIVGIVEQAQPLTLIARTVNRPSKYVLEVPGGWVGKKGIRSGAIVKMDGLGRIEVVP